MRGFVTGGTLVTVRGAGLLNVPTLLCRFGNETVLATFLSLDSIECLSPPVDHSNDVELKVSLNGVDFSALSEKRTFKYDAEIELVRIFPSRVAVTDRHSNITVVGRSFINSTLFYCLFTQNHTTIGHYVSRTEIMGYLPHMMEEGEINVRLSLNGVNSSSANVSLSAVGPSLIISISPRRIEEGHEVEILAKGRNFINSKDVQCRFRLNGHHWSPASWVDANTLTCVTPHLNMTRDGFEFVGISNNGGHDSERQLFGLEITLRMQFVSMHPSIGYTHGGNEGTITLGNLKYMSDLRCLFGTEALPASLISANIVVCILPPYPVGEATLKLMSGKNLLAISTFEFIYPPTVDSLQPAFGELDGGTVLWVYGDGFIGVTLVAFSSTTARSWFLPRSKVM